MGKGTKSLSPMGDIPSLFLGYRSSRVVGGKGLSLFQILRDFQRFTIFFYIIVSNDLEVKTQIRDNSKSKKGVKHEDTNLSGRICNKTLAGD